MHNRVRLNEVEGRVKMERGSGIGKWRLEVGSWRMMIVVNKVSQRQRQAVGHIPEAAT